MRSCEDRVVSVVHRGFAGVLFDRVDIQVVWASPAMAVKKRDTFRFVGDYQAVNSQVEQTPKVMTDLLRDLDCNVWADDVFDFAEDKICLLYTSPSPRDLSTSRMPSSA